MQSLRQSPTALVLHSWLQHPTFGRQPTRDAPTTSRAPSLRDASMHILACLHYCLSSTWFASVIGKTSCELERRSTRSLANGPCNDLGSFNLTLYTGELRELVGALLDLCRRGRVSVENRLRRYARALIRSWPAATLLT